MTTIDDFQNNLNRRPLVELISSNFVQEIPFAGKRLTTNDEWESHPSTLMHSSGRLIVVFSKLGIVDSSGTDNQEVHYYFTDTDRNEFQSPVTWETTNALSDVRGIDLEEMADGNVLITWIEYLSSHFYFRRRIVAQTGTLVSEGAVADWADTDGDVHGVTMLRIE